MRRQMGSSARAGVHVCWQCRRGGSESPNTGERGKGYMAEECLENFRCVVLTPRAKLLDCKTHSITLPAHDGQMGVWRDHMPMLCRLGLGIMEVHDFVTDDDQTPVKHQFSY